ncbi:MAG: hypothetical protein ABFS56_25185 [Pseudomonadota bacterium]
MLYTCLETTRTDDEICWIKKRIEILRKESTISQVERLIEYMYVADIDTHWKKYDKLLSETLKHPSAVFLLELALIWEAKRVEQSRHQFVWLATLLLAQRLSRIRARELG